MKLNLLVALIGSTQAVRFIDNVDDIMNNLVLDSTGVDIAAMHTNGANAIDGKTNWRKPWPQGIDDSTLDNTVLNLGAGERAAAKKEAELKYLDVPVASKDKAVWPQSRVDDGMDDDSVLDKINNKHESLEKIQAPPAKPAAAKEGAEGEKKD